MNQSIDLSFWEQYEDELVENGNHYEPIKPTKYKNAEWQQRKQEDHKLTRKEREERMNSRGKAFDSIQE